MSIFQTTPTPFVYYKGVLASKPSLILTYQNQTLNIQHSKFAYDLNLSPLESLQFIDNLITNLKKKTTFPLTTQTDHPYQYGLIGFLGFEFGLKLLDLELNSKKKNHLPDFYLILPTEIQYLNEQFQTLSTVNIPGDPPLKITPSIPYKPYLETPLTPDLTFKQYQQQFSKIQKLITDGETYQVNFAQRFHTQSQKSPSEIFSHLTQINPSAHQALLSTPDFHIISNSPENLFTKVKNKITTNPIKGTISKPNAPEQLLNSQKDQAELEMIVDLERNDLGKIPKAKNIKVTKHRYIETYNNLHHTLSEIQATIPQKTSFSTIFQAIFPGGSITGCPKHRTCQIIHKLEKTARDSYCGSLGYIDLSLNMQFNILIRTIFNTNFDNYFHAGGGITIQSQAEQEYQELYQKGENLAKILTSQPSNLT